MARRFLDLVRHGEATEDEGGLSDAGQEQARRTGERLPRIPAAGLRLGTPGAARTGSRPLGPEHGHRDQAGPAGEVPPTRR